MIKQLLLPLVAVAAFIILVGIFTQKQSSFNWSKYLPGAVPTQQKTVTIDNKTIQIEIANTESTRKKGLSGKVSLPADSGMLFIFESKQVTPIFWMKDMLFSIDIVWISDSKIVKIDKNIPVPKSGTNDDSLIKYSPDRPVDYVLEVNSGFTDNNYVKVGDSIDLSKI